MSPRPRDTSSFTQGAFTTDLHAPSDSWWAGVDRETFQQRVAARAIEMRRSKFGLVASPSFGPDAVRLPKRRLDTL
jgi:hypothetical protein